jgi:hypothetical protein
LPEEYMLIHDAIVLAGLGADRADEWLESVRNTGMNSRFTMHQVEREDFAPSMDSAFGRDVKPVLFG